MPTPNRLQMNLRDVEEKSGPNPKTKGILTCCGEDGFHIRFTAQTVRSLFGLVSLQDGDDGVRLFAVCPACGKSLMVFDSQIDGYDCVMGRAGAGVLRRGSIEVAPGGRGGSDRPCGARRGISAARPGVLIVAPPAYGVEAELVEVPDEG